MEVKRNLTRKRLILSIPSVFTNEDTSNIPLIGEVYSGSPISDITISDDIVFKKLQEQDVSKSPGPDGWHQQFLKESAEELTVSLRVLFRKFLDSGFIPKEWKIAHVTPVFKKGNLQQSSNY